MPQQRHVTHNFRLELMYDGTLYSGWQIQPHAQSIQQVLQDTIKTVVKEDVTLIGSGRTDAGVHAIGQIAHFKTTKPITLVPFFRSINGILPKDIRLKAIEEVPLDFHAQMSAKAKIYHYHIVLDPIVSPFIRLYVYHHPRPLDRALFEKTAHKFVGTHNFTSFANSATEGSAAKNPIRTIYRLDVIPTEHGLRCEFEGNGFLYKMVRNIVGTLVEVAKGKIPLSQIDHLFKVKDRRQTPKAAPAQGLFLVKVIY